MPTVLQDGPYSFVFFSSDRGEPPHIHVKRDWQITKFWLNPIVLVRNKGFSVQDKNLNLMNLLINCERYGVNSG